MDYRRTKKDIQDCYTGELLCTRECEKSDENGDTQLHYLRDDPDPVDFRHYSGNHDYYTGIFYCRFVQYRSIPGFCPGRFLQRRKRPDHLGGASWGS